MNPEPVGEEPEARVPTEFSQALAAARWRRPSGGVLTPVARRDFIAWMDAAKQPAEHKRWVEEARGMLAAGKRRP